MGEPLNNYSAVVESVRVMTGLPFQLSPKRITISTVNICSVEVEFHRSFLSFPSQAIEFSLAEMRCIEILVWFYFIGAL